MKKFLVFVIAIIVIAIGAYMYVARPVSVPTQDINQAADRLPEGDLIYRISPEKSNVIFSINELLRGEPKLVIGTTTQIVGDIGISGNEITVSTLKINARTFVTDNNSRNGAINRLILKSEDPANEFVTFVPKSNTWSGEIKTGEPMSFDVSGDITIAGVTKPVTFKVNAVVTEEALTGTAESVIKRADFNLVIPSLPFIANVDEDVFVKVIIIADRVASE